MENFLIVLGLALLPALGNFAGGLLAEFLQTSKRNLNRALHAAAGIVLAIVAIDLMPKALENTSAWIIALAFALGGLAYIALEAAIERLQKRGADGSGSTTLWMLYAAVATDLFSDGLMIGAGSTVSSNMALILALGQVLADIPEGFATIVNFKDKNIPRRWRSWLSASFALPVLIATTLAYSLLRGQSNALKMAGLVFTAGLLTVAAVEDMISEAHESIEDTRLSVLIFIGGFVLFTLVSAGLEDYMVKEPAVVTQEGTAVPLAAGSSEASAAEMSKSLRKEAPAICFPEHPRERTEEMAPADLLFPALAVNESSEKAEMAPQVVIVQPGDTLSRIAAHLYGDPAKWRLIYEANRDMINDPNLLRAGMRLTVPSSQR